MKGESPTGLGGGTATLGGKWGEGRVWGCPPASRPRPSPKLPPWGQRGKCAVTPTAKWDGDTKFCEFVGSRDRGAAHRLLTSLSCHQPGWFGWKKRGFGARMRGEDEQGGRCPATRGHPAATRPREQMEGPRGTSSPKRLRRCREVKVKPGAGGIGISQGSGADRASPGPDTAPSAPALGLFFGDGARQQRSRSEGDVVGARRGPEQNKEALTAKVPGNRSAAPAKYFHREVSAPQPGRRQPPRHGCRPKRMLGPPRDARTPPGCVLPGPL